MLESLSSMAVPQSEMVLLQRSTSIGTSKKTKKQMLRELALHQKQHRTNDLLQKGMEKEGGSEDDSTLSGTTWRKKRKRRKLKIEKVMLDPKPPAVCDSSDGSSEDEDEDREPEGRTTLYCVPCES